MIANARMYAVSPEVDRLWHELLSALIASAGLPVEWFDYPAPAPLEDLWRRTDMAAVFMCGLPFSRARPRPLLIAAPVPSPAEFDDAACYWSEFVVRGDSGFSSPAATFGRRIAFTVPDSQSGCIAALSYFASLGEGGKPLFAEIVAPTITPLGALEAVIRGAAEIAPLDAYALRLLRAHRPDLVAQIRVVGRTVPTPIPPLVASPAIAAAGRLEALAAALLAAHTNAALQPLLQGLQLRRFARPDPDAYEILARRFATATEFWRRRPLAALIHPAFAW
jgi:ABC-type phosphate/phosphonate transport system substrate-binding protein